jgi:hypothetical protein
VKAVCWKDEWDVCVLTNIYVPPAERNFREKSGKAMKHLVIEDYNTQMGYADERGHWQLQYEQRTWKWTKELLFHLRSGSSQCSHHPQVFWENNDIQEIQETLDKRPHPSGLCLV